MAAPTPSTRHRSSMVLGLAVLAVVSALGASRKGRTGAGAAAGRAAASGGRGQCRGGWQWTWVAIGACSVAGLVLTAVIARVSRADAGTPARA